MEKNLFEPVPSLLSRTIEHELTQEQLSYYGEALDKLVSIGTHLLNWECQDDDVNSVSGDEALVVAAAFRRLLQLMDAISLQIKVGAVDSAIVHLRVLFEHCVQFEHLISNDTLNRSFCMVVADKYRIVESIRKTPLSKRIPDESSYLEHLETQLGRSELQPYKEEYERLRLSATNKELKWYNLFNNKLSDFSKLVEFEFPAYKTNYRWISKMFGNDAVHSTNLIDGSFVNQDGSTGIIQIRKPIEAFALAGIVHNVIRNPFEKFVKRRAAKRQSEYIKAIMVWEVAHKDLAFPKLNNYNQKNHI